MQLGGPVDRLQGLASSPHREGPRHAGAFSGRGVDSERGSRQSRGAGRRLGPSGRPFQIQSPRLKHNGLGSRAGALGAFSVRQSGRVQKYIEAVKGA